MSSAEELYRNRLLNNEFIEEGAAWVESDEYYCESEDKSLMKVMESDTDSGIKNAVNTFYRTLKSRYHNNFYLEFIPSDDNMIFVLRGQPLFKDTTINLIVKYVLTASKEEFNLKTGIVLPDDSEFDFEKGYVENYNKRVDDNTDDVKRLLDSISLGSYFNNSSDENTCDDSMDAEVNCDTQEKIYCTNCGAENSSSDRKCCKCDATLLSRMTCYGNEISSYDEIICEDAIKKIEGTDVPVDFYEYLLVTIGKKCENINYADDIDAYDQILHITRKFVNVEFNYSNTDSYGDYDWDTVFINPNYSHSQQCSSMIKYLSVEIHLEIMEALFMYIFDVKNNALVRNFIDDCRFTNQGEKIINVYYPIRVESHFIPPEYHSYEEIDRLYATSVSYGKSMTEQEFHSALVKGNSYAHDIIRLLDKIIDDEIKKNIAVEFEYDEEQRVKECANFEIDEVLSTEKVIESLKNSMIENIRKYLENENLKKQLTSFQERFEGKGNAI